MMMIHVPLVLLLLLIMIMTIGNYGSNTSGKTLIPFQPQVSYHLFSDDELQNVSK